VRYAFSTVISAFMMIRFYLLFRVFTRFTKWRSSLADRCSEKIGFDADTIFSLKCVYKDKPFILLGFSLFIGVITFGLSVRLFER
jgi:hypothetical protein